MGPMLDRHHSVGSMHMRAWHLCTCRGLHANALLKHQVKRLPTGAADTSAQLQSVHGKRKQAAAAIDPRSTEGCISVSCATGTYMMDAAQ